MTSIVIGGADDLFAAAAIEPPAAEGYVLCEFAGITLAVPQVDVLTIEHGSELTAPLPGESAIGWFASPQGPWPAYALDAQLQPLNALPGSSAFLVFVKAQPWPLGLLCDSVRIVRARAELRVQALPAIMQHDAGFISAVARTHSGLALVLSESGLAGYLGRQTGREVAYE